ncbi:hypothetical protein V8F20_009765 [Naviculisporaceae sp. PSN 640]
MSSQSPKEGGGTGGSASESGNNPNGNGNSINGDASRDGDKIGRLTEEEKKQNHIASEQKRRTAIREGFDKLSHLVPGMEGQARSEATVLKATVNFLVAQLEKRRQLVMECDARGIPVDPQLRK